MEKRSSSPHYETRQQEVLTENGAVLLENCFPILDDYERQRLKQNLETELYRIFRKYVVLDNDAAV